MSDDCKVKVEELDKFKNIKKADKAWIATFFGTSIGSGILFLPIMAGMAGFYVTVVVMILAFVTSYFAQKLYGLVLVNSEKAQSYNKAIEEYLGFGLASIVSFIFTILLFGGVIAFSTGLNTDIGEFLYQYKITSANISSNPMFPFVMLLIIVLFMVFTESFLLKFVDKLTSVLIVLLIILAIMFIPYWRFDTFLQFPTDLKTVFRNVFLCFPLYMGALFFYQALSPMVMYYRKNYPELSKEEHEKKVIKLNKFAVIILSFFTGIFILSSAFTLTPASISYAYTHNISALAVVGAGSPPTFTLGAIKFLSYLVIFFGLLTSFFGLSLGLIELLQNQIPFPKKWSDLKKKRVTTISLMIFIWIFTTFNINVLGIMGLFSTPFNALILFIIPAGLVLFNKRLKKYSKIAALIMLIIGIFTAFSYFLGLIL
ncbi:MAG TPA: aromatic amino acid transport family protein [Victivallales bacterium]|nr:aromatic amino acid transport family protein [Victivallales bacterium]